MAPQPGAEFVAFSPNIMPAVQALARARTSSRGSPRASCSPRGGHPSPMSASASEASGGRVRTCPALLERLHQDDHKDWPKTPTGRLSTSLPFIKCDIEGEDSAQPPQYHSGDSATTSASSCERAETRQRGSEDGADGPLHFYELLQKLSEAHEVAVASARHQAAAFAMRRQASGFTLELNGLQSFETGPIVSAATSSLPVARAQTSIAVVELPGCCGQPQAYGSVQDVTRVLVPSGRSSSKESVAGTLAANKDFKLLHVWNDDPVSEAESNPHGYSFSLTPRCKLDLIASRSEESLVLGSVYCQSLLLHPSSAKRLLWDVACMIFLFYDIIMIPFTGAFDPPAVPFTIAMNYTTMFFWTLDMVVSVLTGYQDGRHIVLEFNRILKRYLRTWFWLDAIIVGLDWTLFWLGESGAGLGSAARLGRSLRTLRFARTLRLIRLLKVKRIMLEIQDQINTEALSICFRILKIILVLILANHVVACAWYAIGLVGSDQVQDGLSTWVIESGMENRPISYKYVTSLHWSLTQFTPASMEVTPQNVHERLFAVIVLLIAMITFSSFVSILTASMAELRNISSDEARQFWLLRRYLRDWQVSKRFSVHLQRYLEYAYHKQRQRVQAKDVKLLALLSSPLHDELKAETLSVHLITHPLFNSAPSCLRVFSRALSDMYLCRGDCAFSFGERGSAMLFICTGVFSYQLGELTADQLGVDGDYDLCAAGRPQDVREGQWVAEAVLWTCWLHLGDLQALTEGQAISIDSREFGEAVLVFKPAWLAFRGYAHRFVAAMNRIDQKHLTDLLHTLVSPQQIVDSSSFMQHPSLHSNDDHQEPSFLRFGRALWNALADPWVWFSSRKEEQVEEQREFDGLG